MKNLELVQYPHETEPHAFEATVTTGDMQAERNRRHGPVTVGRVQILDEETGKFTWFCVGAKLNKNGQPVLEIVNIRPEQDKITNCAGKWRPAGE